MADAGCLLGSPLSLEDEEWLPSEWNRDNTYSSATITLRRPFATVLAPSSYGVQRRWGSLRIRHRLTTKNPIR